MSEQSIPVPYVVAETQAKLRELAASLREADHLKPETQKALASLLEELSQEFNSTSLTSTKTAHLAETVAEVAQSLNAQHSTGSIAKARDRMKDAAKFAETEASVASGVAYRLIDLLASIGI